MSFSADVKSELNSMIIKGNCCKKAYILGILMSARVLNGSIELKLTDTSTVERFSQLLKTVYKITPERRDFCRGCYKVTELSFVSNSLLDFLRSCDNGGDERAIISSLKCKNCNSVFMGAVFCSCGTVSDPRKSYTLEFRIPNLNRASLVSKVIASCGIPSPHMTERKDSVGLFYRRQSFIEDMLKVFGASKSLFAFFDIAVEKTLRNFENRATNCVATNISKSVAAAALQVSAIEALIRNKMFDELPDELKKTARLRLENPDVSLTELVELHTPSISKSGLNHRLSKLVDEAKNKDLI